MILAFTKAIDHQVDRQFRKDPGGRLVFLPFGSLQKSSFADVLLPFGSKGTGYFVDSKSDEEKIRAFLRMYRSAGALISWLIYLSFYAWIVSFNTSAHRWTSEVLIASFFFLPLLVPVWVLGYLYKQTVPGFTSSLSEVGPDLEGQLSEISPPSRRLRGLALVSLFAGIVLLGVALILMIRPSSRGKSACPPKCVSTSPVRQ